MDKGVTNQDLDKYYFGKAVNRVAKRMCHRYGFKKEVADGATALKDSDLDPSSNNEALRIGLAKREAEIRTLRHLLQ